MSNVIKFQAPFERIKQYNSCPDVNLRKAIITQAIIDASNTAKDIASKKIEKEAKNWLFKKNYTFYDTCMEAGMDPCFVRKIAKSIINLHKRKNNKLHSRSNKDKKIKRQSKTSTSDNLALCHE